MTHDNNKQQKTVLSQPRKRENEIIPAQQKSSESAVMKNIAGDHLGSSIEEPGTQLSQANHKALTQIDSSFHSEVTEQGFAEAKKDADKALSENKVILNERFVLKETLGSGGMGTVYKAQDLRKVEAQDMNPFVAVKILNTDFRNHPDAFISLQREASRSHLLAHPNIVTVHDFDRDGDTIFMTMELLEGEDLESLLARNRHKAINRDKTFEILKDYSTALDFAHNKGIIHSDLKPGNIFVTSEGDTKVLDFGIARLALESKRKDHFDAGRLGAITPAYASLEMIQRESPDARDDVFAAAIIAYEMLTGKHPFNRQSAATALAKGLSPERPENLSKRQWQALASALELKRADRTKTVKEFMIGMTVTPTFPIYRTISIVLMTVVSWFVYNLFFAPDPLSRKIDETLLKATECFEAKNYQCTIESANAILEIAPKHHLAISLREEATIDLLIENIGDCLVSDDSLECAIQGASELAISSPKHPKLTDINQQIESKKLIIEINKLMAVAIDCLANQNYSCTILKASKILTLDPQHQQASHLLQQSSAANEQQQAALVQLEQDFDKLMNRAQKCFKQNRYACSTQNGKLAIELKPGDNVAMELIQASNFAAKEQRKNLQKVIKMLQDGKKCLLKLNYSCAIAKSESALDLMPKHKKALQLKRDARESMDRAKKNITIE